MKTDETKSQVRISRREVAGYVCLGAFIAAMLAVLCVPYDTAAWRLLNGTPWGLVTVVALLFLALFLLGVDPLRSSRRR